MIGAVWTFGDDSCENSFDYGFAAASIMIITSLFMLSITLIGSCITGIAACIGYGLMSNYKDLD